jgi:hypothetical protein
MSAGHRRWFIPDCYIPTVSTGDLESHESICLLNVSHDTAQVEITLYFEDRDPIERVPVVLPGRRTLHVRTSSLSKNGISIPKGVPYAAEVESSIPIIVQYSRLDSTQAANALMTAIGYPAQN